MIIFINGSINSGKSTVARLLSKELPRCANVEIDSLKEFIRWMDIDESISINLENAVSVIRNFRKQDFNVVIPYPLSQKNYEFLIKELQDFNEKIFFFTLKPNIGKAQMSTPERKISQYEHGRIQRHYDSDITAPSFGEVIDNTNQAPQETADYILKKVLAT